jgi:hypothetical protein
LPVGASGCNWVPSDSWVDVFQRFGELHPPLPSLIKVD